MGPDLVSRLGWVSMDLMRHVVLVGRDMGWVDMGSRVGET
jgi:hypothetical protein